MIIKIKEDVWQLDLNSFGSEVYVIKIKNKIILIDTSAKWNREELKEDLKKLKINPSEVNIIILTHNHFDHTGNIKLFKNAKVYGSPKDFNKKKLNGAFMKKFQGIKAVEPEDFEKIININELKIPELKIIETPGHSPGGICILYKDILFSGDTIFHKGGVGRTDLPGGNYEELKNSIKKIKQLNFKILAPGHI